MSDLVDVALPRVRRILIVDDNLLEANEYAQSLKTFMITPIDISLATSIPKAEEILQESLHWDVFIVDMMMPPKKEWSRVLAGDGKFSGSMFADCLRRTHPVTPLIILSNATFEDVRTACESAPLRIGNCCYWQKCSMSPRQLASKLDELFRDGEVHERRATVWERIFGSMILQPNISGIGIDLRQVGDR